MRAPFIVSLSCTAILASLVACGGSAPPPAATPISTIDASAPPPAPSTGAASPDSDKVTWKKDAPAKNCHTAKAAGDYTAAVTGMAKNCVGATMHQLGKATTGTGQASTASMVTTIPLKAKANHCYRAFGLADTTVTDFDIAIIDSAGKSAGEDGTDGNDAIAMEDGSICFKTDDAANVNTAVASGQGKFAVEIWSDE
jgi:hypothetical protein